MPTPYEVLQTARTNAEMGFVETAISNIVEAGGSVGFAPALDRASWFCSVSIVVGLDPYDWPTGSKNGITMADALINAITEAIS